MFLCINGFYTFQGFQGYLICNFWPSILFSIDFTRCSRNLELNFNFEINLTGLTGGADRPGRRGAALLADTISVSPSNFGRAMHIREQEKKRRGDGSPARRNPARASRGLTASLLR
jgi:hypothetical protein